MTKYQRVIALLLRLALGALYFYAGSSKVFDSGWTAKGYLLGAKNFTAFYGWLTQPHILPIIDFVNKWGLTLLGLSLIVGLWVRYSAPLGALLMLLYYLALDFPYPNGHSLVVDEHIVYILALLLLSAIGAGRYWGLDRKTDA